MSIEFLTRGVQFLLSIATIYVGIEEILEKIFPHFEGVTELHHGIIFAGATQLLSSISNIRQTTGSFYKIRKILRFK